MKFATLSDLALINGGTNDTPIIDLDILLGTPTPTCPYPVDPIISFTTQR